jgi:hypothetical protein
MMLLLLLLLQPLLLLLLLTPVSLQLLLDRIFSHAASTVRSLLCTTTQFKPHAHRSFFFISFLAGAIVLLYSVASC